MLRWFLLFAWLLGVSASRAQGPPLPEPVVLLPAQVRQVQPPKITEFNVPDGWTKNHPTTAYQFSARSQARVYAKGAYGPVSAFVGLRRQARSRDQFDVQQELDALRQVHPKLQPTQVQLPTSAQTLVMAFRLPAAQTVAGGAHYLLWLLGPERVQQVDVFVPAFPPQESEALTAQAWETVRRLPFDG